MDTIEVKILQYTFHFRKLSWREEGSLRATKGEDRLRGILALALAEVSGIKVASHEEAMRVLQAIPSSVIQRVFILYKGNFPMPRRFSTMGLYKASEPNKIAKRLEEVEEQRDQTMDRVEREMEQKFGKQELQEQFELERQMAKNSKLRGVTKAAPDESKTGTKPPIKQGFIGKKNAH